MTNANMKLVMLDVTMEDVLENPSQHLDVGEHIVKRVVKLRELEDELNGTSCTSLLSIVLKYAVRVSSAGKLYCYSDIIRSRNEIVKGYAVDARLFHFAKGYAMASRLQRSYDV